MNRSNIGNVVTNAVQVLNVSATAASKVLGKADRALNNMTKLEKREYFASQAEKMKLDTEAYNSLSDKEKEAYALRKYKTETIETTETNDDFIDLVMKKEGLISNEISEQANYLNQNVSNNLKYVSERESALNKFSSEEWKMFFERGGDITDKEFEKYFKGGKE